MATKKQMEAMHARLTKRWAKLLESEMDSDGFWEDVREALGHEDVGDLTEAELKLAHNFIRMGRSWLQRLPKPEVPS